MQHRFPPELAGCAGFDWDAGNDRKSEDKHDVSRAEAEQVFSNLPIVLRPTYGRDGETRQLAHGKTDAGRLLTVVFTLRGTLVRVISARTMRDKDRVNYEQR